MATAVFVYLTTYPNGVGRVFNWQVDNKIDNSSQSERTEELLKVLRNASMENGTVLITALNEAWIEPGSIFDIFLESFRIGDQTEQLLDHLVVVAMDRKAFDRCKSIHRHCYFLVTDQGTDFSSAKKFMSHDYLEMMWDRLEFLKTVLELGYSFVFSDTDIMWLRNPFSRFPNNTHIAIASDYYYGSPSHERNMANCGFVYAKSNTQTIQFYKYWLMNRGSYPTRNEQEIFNAIKRDCYATRLGLQVSFLDTAYYGGFCQSSKDFNKVCTMHANCCVGLERKIHDLRGLLEDWKAYKGKTKAERGEGRFSCCVPKECRMR